ncbi:MAG: hypothetical protein ACFE0I_18890 [Elainellaceae cyanobacterium]
MRVGSDLTAIQLDQKVTASSTFEEVSSIAEIYGCEVYLAFLKNLRFFQAAFTLAIAPFLQRSFQSVINPGGDGAERRVILV